jgi:hypothetical protein
MLTTEPEAPGEHTNVGVDSKARSPYCQGVQTAVRWLLIVAGAIATYLTYLQ